MSRWFVAGQDICKASPGWYCLSSDRRDGIKLLSSWALSQQDEIKIMWQTSQPLHHQHQHQSRTPSLLNLSVSWVYIYVRIFTPGCLRRGELRGGKCSQSEQSDKFSLYKRISLNFLFPSGLERVWGREANPKNVTQWNTKSNTISKS